MIPWMLTIDPVAFRVLGWPVHWYGIIIGVAMFIAYYLVQYEGKRRGIDSDWLSDCYFWAIVYGLIGARLYYVLFRWDYYQHHLDEIVQIWRGGGAIYGAIIAGAVTLYLLARRVQMNILLLGDAVVPALMVAQAIGRWGNFINQEAYGQVVSREHLVMMGLPVWLIEQMNIQGYYVQPTFLYESLWNTLGFLLLMAMQRFVRQWWRGDNLAFYFIWYGTGRMMIEGLRSDSLYIGSLRVSQWLSMFLVVGALGWTLYRHLTQPSDLAINYLRNEE